MSCFQQDQSILKVSLIQSFIIYDDLNVNFQLNCQNKHTTISSFRMAIFHSYGEH